MLRSKSVETLIVGLLSAVRIAWAWDGGTNEADWVQLVSDVAAARTQLDTLVAQAAAEGLETNYAYVSQVVLDRFDTYAQYDRAHPDKIYEALTAQWWDYKVPDQDYHINLPFNEMADCLAVASNAMAELEAQLATTIVLQPPVDFTTGVNTFGNGSCLRNGVPVFPSDFTWMPDDEDLLVAFGRMGGVYYDLGDLDSSGNVKSWPISDDSDSIADQASRNINFGQFFIGHRAASWMVSAHPEIEDGARNFVRYDTDSPLIRGWFTNHWSQYLPSVCGAQGNQPRMHLLANEPNFATRTGGWLADNGVSANTMDRYNDWLQAKYITIENLNATYGTSCLNFEEAEAAMTMPINPADPDTVQGGPVWYDWCRFNMDRINDFFRFLKDGAQGYDPHAAPVTIKILGGQLANSYRDDGMDMEYLAGLMDVTGADLKTVPADVTVINVNLEWGWTNTYVMEWTEQSMMLDFYKSLHPDKPYYDSEWHGFETGKWRAFNMKRNYVRAAMWLGFTHGINCIQSWVWGRENDGSFENVNSSFIGEVLTQPIALDAYGRALKELNAHAQTITDLAQLDRDFLIYYCEESAIQDLDYMADLGDVYEALKLLNLRVGFTTPSKISGAAVSNQTVVVSPTAFISDTSYSNLATFSQSGGKVVLVNGTSAGFALNEFGFAVSGNTNLVPYAAVGFDAVESMADALGTALEPLVPEMPLQVDITDGGSPAYGILAKQAHDPVSGRSAVMLVNVSKVPLTASLSPASGNTISLTNVITGQVSTNVHMLQPCDVVLLEVEEAGAVPPVETGIQWGEIGGDTDIVTNAQDFAVKTVDYMPGVQANPAVGAAYYPLNPGKAPCFNHAASSIYNAKEVMDQPYGDTLHSGKNQADYDAMYAWEDYLLAGSTLSGLDAEVRFSMWGGTGTGTVHWIIRKESGEWYASAGIDLVQYHVNSSSFTSISTADPAGLDWFAFTPVTGGYGSIGVAASIDMGNVTSVGVYYDLSGSGENIYADLRYFKAVTSTGTATGWDQFVMDYGLSGVGTNDFDRDGWSDAYEYGLGGNPTNPAEWGIAPELVYHPDDDVSFYNLEITNTYPGITYVTEWCDNLASGAWSTAFDFQTNYPAADPEFNEAEHRLNGAGSDELFFRLKITQP